MIRTIIFLFSALLLLLSCVKKEEIDDEMSQTFSIPFGEKVLKIDAPTIIDNTSNFFYNGRPYRLVGSHFRKSETLDFELDSISDNDIIQGADFRIRFENTYPANAFVQIYLMSATQLITDSFFVAGLQKIPAGEVNSLSEPSIVATTVIDAEFHGERFNHLKTAKYLHYVFYLEARREDGAALKFTSKSSIDVNLAMRVYLKYNLSKN